MLVVKLATDQPDGVSWRTVTIVIRPRRVTQGLVSAQAQQRKS